MMLVKFAEKNNRKAVVQVWGWGYVKYSKRAHYSDSGNKLSFIDKMTPIPDPPEIDI